MQILSNLWAIQKWMRTQKTFQFYSSSILIVYDARKLRQDLELHKRQKNGNNGSCNNNLDNDSCGDSKSPTTPTSPEKEPPRVVYKKIQRSHSSINNYEQVSDT